MNKLFLTLAIISSLSLSGMESPKQLTPITLPQTYYCLTAELLPEIAQHIFSLQFDLMSQNFQNTIIKNHNDPVNLVEYIKELITSYGYLLASELFEQSFLHAKVSICDIKNYYGQTSLHIAPQKSNDLKIAQILIKIAGKNAWKLLTKKDILGETALHYAIRCSNVEMAKLFFDTAGNNAYKLLAKKNYDYWTGLHYAVYACENNVKMVNVLLDAAGDNGYKLLIMQTKYGQTSLHRAVFNKQIKIVMLLLDIAGDDAQDFMHITDCNGKTAFDIANQEIKEVMEKYMEEKL